VSNGWDKVDNDAKLKIYKKTISGSTPYVKTEAVFEDMDIDVIFEMFINIEIRKQTSTKVKNLAMIESFNANEQIIYQEMVLPTPVSNRDQVQYRAHFCNKTNPDYVKTHQLFEKENKYYMLYMRSCERSDVPEKKGIVRGETVLMGWILEEDISNPKNCNFILVSNVDPKGSIPDFMTKSMAAKMPTGIVASIKDNYKKFAPEIKKKLGKTV